MTTRVPALATVPHLPPRVGAAGLLGRLMLWSSRQIRYRQALQALRRLDDRDLDELEVGRADLPALAWRHALGTEPLQRPNL